MRMPLILALALACPALQANPAIDMDGYLRVSREAAKRASER